jgi:hypothetical protein
MVDVVFGLLIAVPALLLIASFVISPEKSLRPGRPAAPVSRRGRRLLSTGG